MAKDVIKDDLWDDASSEFVRIGDLDGRLIFAVPTSTGKAKGDNGEPYEFAVADVLVVDGEPIELATALPDGGQEVRDMRFTSGPIVRNLKPRVDSGRPVLGRVNSTKGKFGNKAYALGEPTDADKVLARPMVVAYLKARTARLEAETDPFE